MLAKTLQKQRDYKRELGARTRQKLAAEGYKGLTCYVDEETRLFLLDLKAQTGAANLSDVILNILREKKGSITVPPK